MSNTNTIRGYYGFNERTGLGTESTIFTYHDGIHTWYVVEGSQNVNCTFDEYIMDGFNVEKVEDIDTFTANKPIESADELEAEADIYLYG
jgi:hypothetical protein